MFVIGGIYMKIVDREKFVRGVFTILMLTVTVVLYFSHASLSKTDLKTKSIYVDSGDTLWSIAKEEQKGNKYYENKTIQEIVYSIQNFNTLDNGYIYAGQKLLIPEY